MAHGHYHYQDAIYPQVHYVQLPQREFNTDGCYLFVMFPSYGGSNVHEVGKACVLARRTMRTHGGSLVGIARKLFSYGFETKTEEACVVFLFPNRAAAETFFWSDPNFKQPDFPQCAGHCQAWIIDRHYTPDKEEDFNTFMVSEIRLRRPDAPLDYKQHFATPFADLIQKYNGQPYVVQTTECHGLRRFCKDPSHIVTIHLFKNHRCLDDVMNDPKYEELRRIHQSMALEMCTVFTINRSPCP